MAELPMDPSPAVDADYGDADKAIEEALRLAHAGEDFFPPLLAFIWHTPGDHLEIVGAAVDADAQDLIAAALQSWAMLYSRHVEAPARDRGAES